MTEGLEPKAHSFEPFEIARPLVPGLSVGILLGVLVIVASWVLIWIYVRWANRHYDRAVADLRSRR